MTAVQEYFDAIAQFTDSSEHFFAVVEPFFRDFRAINLLSEGELGALVSSDSRYAKTRLALYDRLPVAYQRRCDAFVAVCGRRQRQWNNVLALQDRARRESA
jgi:hypothetical protein